MPLPRENAYICQKCMWVTVTVDVDEGVTPFMISCKRPERCDGMATSSFYPKEPRPPQIPAPAWEWYRPTEKQAKRKERDYPGTLEHVQRGGLLLRPRTNRPAVLHKEGA